MTYHAPDRILRRCKIFYFGVVLFIFGCVLLIVNTVGLFLQPTFQSEDSRGKIINQLPGYHYSIREADQLLDVWHNVHNEFDLDKTNILIYETLKHSSKREIRFYENWIFWVTGCCFKSFKRTQDAERLIRGRAAQCGEAAMVLNTMAERSGLRTRLVGLNGHVVSEVETEKGWRVADPDYGVTYPVDLKTLESEAGPGIIRKLLVIRGYDAGTIEKYISLFQSSQDNVCNRSSVALSPRMYKIEIISDYLKWIIPVFFIVIALGCMKRTVSNSSFRT